MPFDLFFLCNYCITINNLHLYNILVNEIYLNNDSIIAEVKTFSNCGGFGCDLCSVKGNYFNSLLGLFYKDVKEIAAKKTELRLYYNESVAPKFKRNSLTLYIS